MKPLLLAAALACVLACAGSAQQSPSAQESPRIAVTGEAVVNVVPDKIVIRFGIESWDVDILAAKAKNNETHSKAMQAFKECGVPEKEIQTDHLSIEPRWRSESRREDFIGFFVRNTVVVTLADPAKVEEVVTRALQAGINYIHGIDFQTTEFKKYREQAREMALKAAREKAEKMAAALGMKVGDPVQIGDYGYSPWGYWSGWGGWGAGNYSGMSQNVSQNISGGQGELPETVALGKIEIRANVSVTFEMRK